MEYEDLDDWNPMEDDYHNQNFNNYGGGYSQPCPEVQRPGLLPHPPNVRRSDVIVTNISHLDRNALFNLFSQCGTVLNLELKTTHSGNRIGHVSFATHEGAVEAVRRFHVTGQNGMNVEHYNRPLKQFPSQTFPQHRGRGQGYTPRSGGHFMRGSIAGSHIYKSRNYFDNDDVDVPFQYLSITKDTSERTVFVDNSRCVDYKVVRKDRTCLRCGNDGVYKCTKCNGCYCSKQCQINHWAVHKNVCRLSGEENPGNHVASGGYESNFRSRNQRGKNSTTNFQTCQQLTSTGFHNRSRPEHQRSSNVAGTSAPYQPEHQRSSNVAGTSAPYQPEHQRSSNVAGASAPYRPEHERSSNVAGTSGPYQPEHERSSNVAGTSGPYQPEHQRSSNVAGTSGPYQPDSSSSDLQSRPRYQHRTNSKDNSQQLDCFGSNVKSKSLMAVDLQSYSDSPSTNGNSLPSGSELKSLPVASELNNVRGGGHVGRNSRFIHDSKKFNLKSPLCEGGEVSLSVSGDLPIFSRQIDSNQKVTLQLNVPIEVEVSHSDSASNFFVQLCDLKEELETIMRDLQVDASNKAAPKCLAVDQMIAAKFTDGYWYRAVVKEVNSDDTVSICYIDYGNVATTMRQNVRMLSERLALMPQKAVLCSLAKVEPLSSVWTEKNNAAFKLSVDNVKLHAICLEVVEGKHEVCLKDVEESDVGDILCASGDARPKTYLYEQSNNRETMSSILDYWMVGEDKSVAFMGHNSESEQWFMSLPSSEQDVESLLKTLGDDFCPDTSNSFAHVGAIVCARSPADGDWYRAVVRSMANEEILVQYVDFGNSEVVTELCRVPEKHCCTSTLAVLFVFESVSDAAAAHHGLDDDKGTLVVKVVEIQPGYAKVQVEIVDKVVEAMVYSVMHERNNITEGVSTASKDVVCDVLLTESVAASASKPESAHKEIQIIGPNTGDEEVKTQKQMTENKITICDFPLPTADMEVIVQHVESLDSIYVWVTGSHLDFVQNLQESLSEACEKESPLTKLPNVGQFVCGQFTVDDSWYRSRVVDISSFDAVKVLYVDFGNNEILPLNRLKTLLPEFCHIPSLALQVRVDVKASVSFANVKDVLMKNRNDSWVMSVLDDTTTPVTVKLVNDGRTLDEVLGGKLQDSITVPDRKLVPATVEMKTDSTHIDMKTKQQETRAPAVAKSRCNRVTLEVGSKVDIIVLEISSKGHIYACVKNEEQLTALDLLVEKMSEWCEKEKVPLATPTVGTMCLAKSAEYKQWYRAEILFVHGDKCFVFYVDYGNSELVANDLLRPILPEFCLFPLQVVECKLREFNSGKDYYISASREDLNRSYVVDVVKKEGDIYDIYRN